MGSLKIHPKLFPRPALGFLLSFVCMCWTSHSAKAVNMGIALSNFSCAHPVCCLCKAVGLPGKCSVDPSVNLLVYLLWGYFLFFFLLLYILQRSLCRLILKFFKNFPRWDYIFFQPAYYSVKPVNSDLYLSQSMNYSANSLIISFLYVP